VSAPQNAARAVGTQTARVKGSNEGGAVSDQERAERLRAAVEEALASGSDINTWSAILLEALIEDDRLRAER
jgi:hypothetical protein